MGGNKYSIIITFHQQEEFLKYCLEALLPTITDLCEVVIVGTGLRSINLKPHFDDNRIRLLNLETSLPYPSAINAGVKAAINDILIFLDQDIVPSKNWFKSISAFHNQIINRGELAILGSKLLDIQTGRIIDFGIGFTKYNAPHPWRGQESDFSLCNQSYEVQAACSATMMMHRKVFEEIGGMDEGLPYSYCDIDLCLRAKQKGYKTWVVHDSRLYHYNGIPKSNKSHYKEDTKGLFLAKNHSRIKEDMGRYLKLNWNHFKKNHNVQPEYFLLNMLTVIDRDWYVDYIQTQMGLILLGQLTINTIGRDSNHINLYKTLPWSIMRKALPLIFLVDQSFSLTDNKLWRSSRNNEYDIVIDRNGNVQAFNL